MFEVGSGSESEHNGSEDPSCAEDKNGKILFRKDDKDRNV